MSDSHKIMTELELMLIFHILPEESNQRLSTMKNYLLGTETRYENK